MIFNSLFKYLDDNNLLTSNQSGFRFTLLSITHEIYKVFDENQSLDVRGFFQTYQKPLIEFSMMV